MPARSAAAKLLHGVLHDGTMISELINSNDGPMKDLPPSARARAQSLALSTLRNLAPLDVVLDQFLNKSPPLKVRNALRLAANEMLVGGVAAHAAVDAAVRLVRESRKLQHLSGLTNAVARRVAEHGPEIWADMEPQELPSWLGNPIEKAYGPDALRNIEAIHAKGAPLDLTVRKQADAETLAKALEAELLPTGSLRLQKPGQVSTMAGYEDGLWWVQDAAAAMPAKLLGNIKGQRVLDLCAAPGGKTMQLAAGGAEVTAVDISKERLVRVSDNLKRTKLSAKVIASDIVRWAPETTFDAILLDAPCSATGTIRRHPDLPFGKSGDLKPILRLQQKLLARAFEWLKPGGKLVYCTCSLLPAEGEDQIVKFMQNHDDAKQLPADTNLPDLPAEWIANDGGLRLRPDFWLERGGMDGFYATIVEKADLPE